MLLLPTCFVGARSFLSRSACRHADRTISSRDSHRGSGVWSLRIPERILPRPFLLIARTSRIVTAADVATSTGGSTGFPSIQPDFVVGTTAVQPIVTAAVYRGFGSKLRTLRH